MLFGLQDCVLVKRLIENSDDMERRRVELHKFNCMVALAEATTCRRRVLLNYFNETLAENCGNCDVCLNPPETFDATVLAQKALSCVYRVQQRYGVNYVIDVLRGSDSSRIKNLHHDQLSTYGIGSDQSQEEWYNIFRQLIHLGYLEQDIANYSVLKLTERARDILRGEVELMLAKARTKVATKKKGKAKKGSKVAADINYDENLFAKLRHLRKTLATAASVPPFMIFSDAALQEMCIHFPQR